MIYAFKPSLACRTAAALAIALAALSGCGDLPQPFAGRPGLNALRLATPPPARLVVPTPGGALLGDQQAILFAHAIATTLVAQEVPAFAEAPTRGDWQLRLTAALHGSTVQPRFTLLDAGGHARGDIDGDALPASVWVQGDPAMLQQEAGTAAPQIVALLRSVDAAAKQSDPNSLYNRPARVFLAGVAGAPGDGDRSLLWQLRVKFPDTGDLLVQHPDQADFIVHGVVRVTNLPTQEQQVEIHWLVMDASGKEAGDVAQGHDIAKGSLDHFWGDVAVAVAAEAAGGIHEVITNWSGRREAARG